MASGKVRVHRDQNNSIITVQLFCHRQFVQNKNYDLIKKSRADRVWNLEFRLLVPQTEIKLCGGGARVRVHSWATVQGRRSVCLRQSHADFCTRPCCSLITKQWLAIYQSMCHIMSYYLTLQPEQ